LTESYRFGDTNYAKEELRAELASVFMAAERGIPHDPEQHAAYVGSWIQSLKEDKNEIFRAAHDASAATDFLLALERDRSIADQALEAGPGAGAATAGSSRAARPAFGPLSLGDLQQVVLRPSFNLLSAHADRIGRLLLR
jgi:Zincin-like metallopeptidase